MKLLSLIAVIFLSVFSTSIVAHGVENSSVVINGNKQISRNTILDILQLDKNNTIISVENANNFQKKLFKSNFFSNIDIKISEKKIIITVTENPIIEYLFITGVKNKSLKAKLLSSISLVESNIFSEVLLNENVKLISKILTDNGYFNNKVFYNIKKIENNRVNIFFDIKLNKKFRIKNIYFIGDKKISSSKLFDQITSTEYSFLSFFSSTHTPSVDRINYDVLALKRFFLNKGYFDVQIPSGSIEINENNSVNLIFSINAGNKFTFNKAILNNKSVSLQAKDKTYITSLIKDIDKEVYNNKLLYDVNLKINDYFGKNNISALSNYSVKKIPLNKILSTFLIKEKDNKKFINNILLVGNDITEEKVVRNNIYFSEGDVFNDYLLKKSIDNLMALSIFSDVKINFSEIDRSNNVNINIKVIENSTGEISAGAGFGTNGALISFNIRENNFLGKGILSNISANVGTNKISGNAFVSNPDFADTNNTLNNNFYIQKFSYSNSGYENKVIGDTISLQYDYFQNLSLETGIGIDYDQVSAEDKASAIVKKREGNYITSKIFYKVASDNRDSKYNTKSGYIYGFSQSLAIPPSDISYFSNSLFGSFYKDLSESFIGTIKYNIKSINSLTTNEDIKLSDRLYLNENQLRGFTYREFGPKLDGDYVGGNYSYSTTIATTFPNGLPDKWGTKSNVFLDIGNVWGTDFDSSYSSDALKSSAGVGFSWISPIGPLSVIYAEPITKDKNDNVQKFNFKIGSVF